MRPDWYTVNETLSDEEADYLIKLAEPKRERAGIGNRKEKVWEVRKAVGKRRYVKNGRAHQVCPQCLR